jgi:hypothetical protein
MEKQHKMQMQGNFGYGEGGEGGIDGFNETRELTAEEQQNEDEERQREEIERMQNERPTKKHKPGPEERQRIRDAKALALDPNFISASAAAAAEAAAEAAAAAVGATFGDFDGADVDFGVDGNGDAAGVGVGDGYAAPVAVAGMKKVENRAPKKERAPRATARKSSSSAAERRPRSYSNVGTKHDPKLPDLTIGEKYPGSRNLYSSILLSIQQPMNKSAQLARKLLFGVAVEHRCLILSIISLGFYYSRQGQLVVM